MANFSGREAARRTMLADMGVDVWVLRDRGDGIANDASDTVADTPAATPPVTRPVPTMAHPPPTVADPPPTVVHPPAVTADTADAEQVSVTCLVSGEVVMLADDCTPERKRLAADILAAAAGHGRGASPDSSQELTFSWDGDEQSQWRALRAFVDKQLADHRPKTVLCSGGLCPRLEDQLARHRVVVLAELAELGKRMDLKRELWRQIQNLRT